MATETDQNSEFFKGVTKLFPRDLTFRLKITLIIITVLIVIVGNILLLFLPQTKGFLIDDLSSSNVMSFDDINYTLDSGYELDFNQGGYIVPIEQNNNPLGIVIYANGNINYDQNQYITDETYIFLREDEYYQIMGDLVLYNSEEEFFINNAKNAFPTILGKTPFLETPIGKKHYPLSEKYGHIVANVDDSFINITDINNEGLFNKSTFFLVSLIHVMFTIAVLFAIIVMTDRKPIDEPNRSLNSRKVSSKPLKISLLTNFLWLGLLYLKPNIYTVQIILMISLGYILYLLYFKNEVRSFDLKFINYSKNTLIFLPLTIALITFLLFGNTSITLQSMKLNLTFENMFFLTTSLTWLSFMLYSFIPFLHREFDKQKFECLTIVIYSIIVYLVFSLIDIGRLNSYNIYNAILFIPIFTLTLYLYSKRVYNFISPLLTVLFVRVLIGIIR